MAQRKKMSFTVRYVLMTGLVLLVANAVLGVVSLRWSMAEMKTLINKNMLDIVKSAAGLVDGDVLGALTEDDVGTEPFNAIADQLTVFLDNVEIEFIYAVRQVSEDKFVFTVDPDPLEPAAFGEDIVVSDGLKQAGSGVAAVDDMQLADRWGSFYSAYSPVFDSAGAVAGVIGVDFDAAWYNEQMKQHTLTVGATSLLSVLMGGVVIFLITHRIHSKFRELDAGLSDLSDNVDMLMDEVVTMSGRPALPATEIDPRSDELEVLGVKIHDMQAELGMYLEFLHNQAYIDALTRVCSSTAYHELLKDLAAKIEAGTARFCVAVFDINSLKEINDTHGHECGDRIIRGAGSTISAEFGTTQTYRIGGDEFAVVVENMEEADMQAKLEAVDARVAKFNAQNKSLGVLLSISSGMAGYRPGEDAGYRALFARADQAMYEKKRLYYQTVGDRRHSAGK